MSNSRQFLVPVNYDIMKNVYSNDDIVHKRRYLIDDLTSTKQYYQTNINTLSSEENVESKFYADKLRQRAKY
ncbi:unnamed protein product [Rotaria sordida]|uniref:Uncharacterized protein n=1 Tax=Rotaria sordida TaxID=392033 RepID=A0A814BKW1_9BILA|nr:unnamed protein product [Rotaria sordida]CAF0871145.1 unnamed protein product [Rotaria sordida]CAF0930740.1 unnamed protein product [Rotaria sordida]CAF3623580.1 unnamed protein product [Rotaria sordida]CAF3818650.1 unnamed protein product [Rotaria sordida]